MSITKYNTLENGRNKLIWQLAEKLRMSRYPKHTLREIYFSLKNNTKL